MKSALLSTFVTTASLTAQTSGGTVITPESYGAKGDGVTDDTSSIQSALDGCNGVSDCLVELSEGQTYLSGPLWIHNPLELKLSGNLEALDREDYPQETSDCFLRIQDVDNVTLTGNGGTIDLKGEPYWKCKKFDCWRPHGIIFSNCNNVLVQGLHVKNSPNHFLKHFDGNNVRFDNIHLEAPYNSKNTDGLNFGGKGNNRVLSNSVISSGDDCFSVVAGGDSEDCINDPEDCWGGNVLVENVVCEGGHGAAIGSLRHGVISNVTVRNVTLTGEPHDTQGLYSGGGCRVKTYPNGTGRISDITFEDIHIRGVAFPIQVLGKYCPLSQSPWPCPEGETAVKMNNIVFKNFDGYGARSLVGQFDCGSIQTCEDIIVDNVNLTGPDRFTFKDAFYECKNCYGTAMASTPESCLLTK